MNEIIKCKARNENKLHPAEFQKLFKEECTKEGQIIQLQFIDNFALGIIVKQQ